MMKREKKRKHIGKRLLTMALLCATMATTFIGFSTPVKVSAEMDAMSRITQGIKLWSATGLESLEDVEKVSTADLRYLALYLSNYYVPFKTVLDSKDNKQPNIDMLTEALTTIGYNEDVAKALVGAIYKASLDSAELLYYDYEKDTGLGYDDTGSPLFGTSYLSTNFGGKDAFGDGGKFDLDPSSNDSNDNGGHATTTNNNQIYVAADTLQNSKYQAATQADEATLKSGKVPATLFFMLSRMDRIGDRVYVAEKGYGDYKSLSASNGGGATDCIFNLYTKSSGNKSVFSITTATTAFYSSLMYHSSGLQNGELGNAVVNYKKEVKTEDELAVYCSLFQNLYIDWVGNVLCDLGDSVVVVYPACINTRVFKPVDSDDASRNINFVSTHGLRYAQDFKNQKYSYLCVPFVQHKGSTKAANFEKGGLNLWDKYNDLSKLLSGFDVSTQNTTGNKFEGGLGGFTKEMAVGWGGSLPNSEDTAQHEDGGDAVSAMLVSGYGTYFTLSNAMYRGKRDSQVTSLDHIEKSTLTDIMYYSSIENTNIEGIKANEFQTGNIVDAIENHEYFTTTTKFNTQGNSEMFQYSAGDKGMLSCIALTYLYGFANTGETEFDAAKHKVNLQFNADIFPKVTDEFDLGTALEEAAKENGSGDNALKEKAFEVMNMSYYIMHPTEGGTYVATLLKNKTMAVMDGWHRDIVGGSDSNSTTGMTHYLGFSGYTTTPRLSEVSWIDSLLNGYDSIVVNLVIIVMIVVFCNIVLGNMTLQRGIVGVIGFAILAFLPPLLINMTVDTANKVSDSIYNKKFGYWAVTQMETYLDGLNAVTNATTESDYMGSLMELSASTDISVGYSGVKLKWQTPKKMSTDEAVAGETENLLDKDTGLSDALVNQVTTNVANSMSGEAFAGNGLAYLYRDYLDIYRNASIPYNIFNTFSYGDSHKTKSSLLYVGRNDGGNDSNKVGKVWTASTGKLKKIQTGSGIPLSNFVMANLEGSTIYSSLSNDIKKTNSINASERGFLVDSVGCSDLHKLGKRVNYFTHEGGSTATTPYLAYTAPITQMANEYIKLQSDIKNGISITVNSLVSGESIYGLDDIDFSLDVSTLAEEGKGAKTLTQKDINNLGYLYFGLNSESPFYYLSFNAQDQMGALTDYQYNYGSLTASAGKNNFVNMLLSENQDYFFNMSENAGDGLGELRDYMNMHDLFYYVIPTLKIGNDTVDMFDKYYGFDYDPSCPLSFPNDEGFMYGGKLYDSISTFKPVLDKLSEGDVYAFWKNYNIHTLYNSYSAWVDVMYDCKYAESETIKVAGKKFTVACPLDPSTYFKLDSNGNMVEGRYMVFSESERKYYGLEEYDLTTVEKKIINMQKNVYKSSLKLLDYYVLSDETLINAYAMNQLFEFNKEFSQVGLFKQQVLYPQAYELKAFSYDAYLRMILSGATGEMIQTETGESIYTRVMHKTSWFFGIFLLLNDLLAVYLIPALRLFIIITVFLLSIIMITGACLKLEFNFAKTLWSSLLNPLGTYLLVTMGMSYLVSLFMYDNTSGVTGDNTYISLGDPTMTMIVMVIINAIVVVLYFNLCMKILKSIKALGGALAQTIKGTVLGAGGALTGALTIGAVGALGLSGAGQVGSAGARVAGAAGRAGAKGVGMAAGKIKAKRAGEQATNTPTDNKYDTRVDRGAQARVTKGMTANEDGTFTDKNGNVISQKEANRRIIQSSKARANSKTGKSADKADTPSQATQNRTKRKATKVAGGNAQVSKKNTPVVKTTKTPTAPSRRSRNSTRKSKKLAKQSKKSVRNKKRIAPKKKAKVRKK